MRSARAGTAKREARVLVTPIVTPIVTPVVAVLGYDRRRSIKIAQLNVEVVGWRLVVLGTKIGGRARDVPCVGLLDCELANRPALHLVSVEQLRSGHALEHQGQLPG